MSSPQMMMNVLMTTGEINPSLRTLQKYETVCLCLVLPVITVNKLSH